MFWNQQVETLPRVDMTAWQSYKVAKVIERVYEKNSLYKKRMEECGILPQDITELASLKKMPFTTRCDITDNYPYGLVTMPISGISYIHRTQDAIHGNTAMSYTRNDITMWTELIARMLISGGMNVTSVFQSVGKPQDYASCVGMHAAIQQIGATLIPGNVISTRDQVQLIQDFGITAVFSQASYMLTLAQEAENMQWKPEELPLQNIFCDMQSLSAESGKEIQKTYNIRPLMIYGMHDIWGMGIAGECHCGGLHLQEDCFYPEIIQPESGQVLPIEQAGELVLTGLTLEAMPLIRYRTSVICSLDNTPCACGRTLIRIKK